MECQETGQVIHVPAGICTGSGLCAPNVRLNLFIMLGVWITTQIDYFVINFNLKHMDGSVFLNMSLAGVSEIFAHIFVGVFFTKLGPRNALMMGYALALTGSIPLVF